MSGPPPPIRSGRSDGFAPPPLKLGGGAPPQLSIRSGGGPPQLRLGSSQASSSESSRALQELHSKVTTLADGVLKKVAFLSPRDSKPESLKGLSPMRISLTSSDLENLANAQTTPAKVQALAQKALRTHTSSSSESLSESSESPDTSRRTSSQERIQDESGRNFDVTIETETAPFVTTGRDGRKIYGDPITTSELTIEQVTDILPNNNPQMDSAIMGEFITKNIGKTHLQEAKDLFSSVINELAKSPSATPISIDLHCGGKQFRLIFDSSKNEVLLFNKEKFAEGTEKTVHDAVAIPIPNARSGVRRPDVESRAVLYSKPGMKSLLERGIVYAQKLHQEAGEDPRKNYIISPPKSEYLTSDGSLMISSEKFSADLLSSESDTSMKIFQTHLLQGLEGLRLLHEKGFVHCDAKLENMFVKGDTCQIGDLSTCRNKSAEFPPYAKDEDRENTRSEDKRSYDILTLGKSFYDPPTKRDFIAELKAKPQTRESSAFIERLEALIPLMTKTDPNERPTIDQVIARLRG